MKNFDASQLSHFTGTERYYRISRRHLLTDGTKYLAEEAECFWMMDAIASHLSEIGTDDWFVQVRMTVNDNRATMIYEDGNGEEHAREEIPFTDFPMPSVNWGQIPIVLMFREPSCSLLVFGSAKDYRWNCVSGG